MQGKMEPHPAGKRRFSAFLPFFSAFCQNGFFVVPKLAILSRAGHRKHNRTAFGRSGQLRVFEYCFSFFVRQRAARRGRAGRPARRFALQKKTASAGSRSGFLFAGRRLILRRRSFPLSFCGTGFCRPGNTGRTGLRRRPRRKWKWRRFPRHSR